MKRTVLVSTDLSCPSCVVKIEKKLGSMPGVKSAKVHFTSGRIVVEHDAAAPSVDALADEVRRLGYSAEVARS